MSIYTWSLDDVCDADDIECQNPEISNPGEIIYGQCYRHAALRRLLKVSFLTCLKECMKTSTCSSVSYRRSWKMCDMNGNVNSEVELVHEHGCFSSNISSWSKKLVGKCATHRCAEGYKCVSKRDRISCEIAYCIRRPNVANALLHEPFGLSRDLGHGMMYKCGNGFKLSGKPFAVCRNNGIWKFLFTCGGRLRKMLVHVGKNSETSNMEVCGQFIGPAVNGQVIVTLCNTLPEGHIVKLTSINDEPTFFHLTEVEVYGV
ncbi:Hypothetical predicted protein [Mytilus galloprovincialis]|nr:Hypothetical predicted protein [Mytilus galloprovincialis]